MRRLAIVVAMVGCMIAVLDRPAAAVSVDGGFEVITGGASFSFVSGFPATETIQISGVPTLPGGVDLSVADLTVTKQSTLGAFGFYTYDDLPGFLTFSNGVTFNLLASEINKGSNPATRTYGGKPIRGVLTDGVSSRAVKGDFFAVVSTATGTRTLIIAIPAVPVPATLPLLAGAIGVFGLLGWRREASVR